MTRRRSPAHIKQESQLLRLLFPKPDRSSTAKKSSKLFGATAASNTRTIDNHIVTFRKYFEKDPKNPVHTLSGVLATNSTQVNQLNYSRLIGFVLLNKEATIGFASVY